MPQPLVITPSLNADTHADGDVVAAPEELVNFVQEPGGAARIDTIVVVDESDTAADIDLVFLSANGSIGAESATFTMTDAVAQTVIGYINIAAADYVADGVNNRVACVRNVNLVMNAAEGETSIWMGIVADAALTPAVDDLTIKIGRTFL